MLKNIQKKIYFKLNFILIIFLKKKLKKNRKFY
jgi:hypothetical protein